MRFLLSSLKAGSHRNPLPQTLQRRIQLAPLRIAGLVGSEVGLVRLDALGDLDSLTAGFVKVGPVSRAHASHQRRTKRAALFGGEHLDRVAIDTGLNLAPQR